MASESQSEVALEAQVEQMLRSTRLSYAKEVVVGEARPDFLVTTKNGDQIVIEVKAWESSPSSTARAISQAQRYKELCKAGAAVVVSPGVSEAFTSAAIAVTPMAEFISTIAALAMTLAQSKKCRNPSSCTRHRRRRCLLPCPSPNSTTIHFSSPLSQRL